MKSILCFALLIQEGAAELRVSRRAADVRAKQPQLWDGAKVLGSDGPNNQCHWQYMSGGSFLGGGSAPNMCLRGYADIVSDAVKHQGTWGDCPALASWWTFLHSQGGQSEVGQDKLYVDVGTNIGACLLPMVARPDVHDAFAFEPNPANLFYLTNSILANPTTKQKVKLYPFALGDESKTRPIYVEHGNAGNTVVGESTHASPGQGGQVQIYKLDDILMTGTTSPYIHLMKLDAQGYEVKILKGASKLFASGIVNAVKFELATEWLLKQGTSSAEYMSTFMLYGFQIYHTDTKQLLSQSELHHVACGPPVVQDFVAVHLKEGEVATQAPIGC